MDPRQSLTVIPSQEMVIQLDQELQTGADPAKISTLLETLYTALAVQSPEPSQASLLESALAYPRVLNQLVQLAWSKEQFDLAVNWSTQLVEELPVVDSYILRSFSYSLRAGNASMNGQDTVVKADMGTALSDLDSAIKIDSKNPLGWYYRARFKRSQGDSDAALADYNQAIILNPENINLYFERGQFRLERQEYDPARSDFESAVSLAPENPMALGNLADFHLTYGDHLSDDGESDEALAEYRLALAGYEGIITIEPGTVLAFIRQGEVYRRMGDLPQALEAYSHAIELDPHDTTSLNQRGLLWMDQGKFEQALADFDQLTSLLPDDPVAYRLRADAHLSLNHPDQALSDYSQATTLDPKFTAARLGKSFVLRSSGQVDSAIEEVSQILEYAPDDLDALFTRGQLYMERLDYQSALVDFEKLVALVPENTLPYRWRGEALASLGRYDDALIDFAKALELDPENFEAYNLRGLVYMDLGQFGKALKDFKLLVKLLPGNPVSYRLRAEAQSSLGHDKQALSDFNQAIQLDPRFYEAYLGKASILTVQGKFTGALRVCNQAIEIRPEDAAGFLRRSEIYRAQADQLTSQADSEQAKQLYTLALADLERAVSFDPQNEPAFQAQGSLLLQLDRSSEALQSYTQAVRANPRSTENYLIRAQIYRQLSSLGKAKNDYQSVLALDPRNLEAYIGLGDVLSAQANDAQALSYYEKALKIDPSYVEAYIGHGLSSLSLGESYQTRRFFDQMKLSYLDACRDFEQALSIQDDSYTNWLLGLARRNIENYDGAFQAFERAFGAFGDQDDAWCALLLAEKGETLRLWANAIKGAPKQKAKTVELLTDAVQAFDQAIALAPDSSELSWAANSRGLAMMAQGDYPAALQAFVSILQKREAPDPWAQVNVGQIHYRQKNYAQALRAFDSVLEPSSDDQAASIWAYLGKGLVYEQSAEMDLAEAAYANASEAIKATFSGVDVPLERASILQAFEDDAAYRRAEKDLREALTWGEKWAEVLNTLAWFYVDKQPTPENIQKSINLARLAVQAEGEGAQRGNYLDTLGWAYFLSGNLAQAADFLEQAVTRDNYDTDIHIHYQIVKEAVAAKK